MISFLRKGKAMDSAASYDGAGHGSSLALYLLPGIVLAAAVIVLGWYAGMLVENRVEARARTALAEGVAKLVAAELGTVLGQIRRTLQSAAVDSRTLAALDAKRPPDSRWGEPLARALPGALWVRLVPRGWEDLDPTAKPPFGFASLELARQAERSGQPTAFEVHQPGSAQVHIAVAVPVRRGGSGPVLGTIHAALSPRWIWDLVGNLPSSTGVAVALRQRLPGGGVRVFAGDSAGDKASTGITIPGSIWDLGYATTIPERKVTESLLFWTLPWIILALIAPLIVWRLRLAQGALREDQGYVVDLVEALVSGRPPVRPRPRLAESEALLARLDSLLRVRTARPAAAAPVSASPESPAAPPGPDETAIDVAFGRVRPGAPGGRGAGPLPAGIFTAYDIRGLAGTTLTPEVMTLLGRAIGSEAYEHGQQTVILGRDCRESGAVLADALVQGLRASGRDVVDLGMVPTPLLYFATRFLGSDCGVMVTGSHNPPEYNGLKLELGGDALTGEQLQALARRVERGDLLQGEGAYRTQDLLADYVDRVASDVRLARPMKVVVDCGNGSAGRLVPILLRTLGCEVVELYCDPDGRFPNHHPDPSRPENLAELSAAVQRESADLGLAFDADGDRLGVVDTLGKIIWPDRLLMLFAQDVLSRQPGADIIYDVKSTRDLASYILLHGGRPLMWKSGHSLMRAKLKETGALLAGELSGHVFFEERWYGFDDGPYAGARLLEILSEDPRPPAEVFAELPESLSTPELLVATPKGNQHELAQRMVARADLKGATLTTIDGLRAELGKGWGLVRASNTTPHLVFRFEADDAASLAEIETLFRKLALSVDPDLQLPF